MATLFIAKLCAMCWQDAAKKAGFCRSLECSEGEVAGWAKAARLDALPPLGAIARLLAAVASTKEEEAAFVAARARIPQGSLVDVFGVISAVDPLRVTNLSHTVDGMSTKRSAKSRDVTLTDESHSTIVVEMSGAFLDSVTDIDVGKVLVAKTVLVDTRCLSTNHATHLQIQPQHPHVQKLHAWWAAGPSTVKSSAPTHRRSSRAVNMSLCTLTAQNFHPCHEGLLRTLYMKTWQQALAGDPDCQVKMANVLSTQVGMCGIFHVPDLEESARYF